MSAEAFLTHSGERLCSLKGFIPLYDLLQSPHNLILRSSQTTFFPASFFFPVPEVGSSHTPIKNKINLKKKKRQEEGAVSAMADPGKHVFPQQTGMVSWGEEDG
jgi:hypothetical protein